MQSEKLEKAAQIIKQLIEDSLLSAHTTSNLRNDEMKLKKAMNEAKQLGIIDKDWEPYEKFLT